MLHTIRHEARNGGQNENEAKHEITLCSVEDPLRDRIAATGTEFRRIPPEVIRGPKCAKDGQVVGNAKEADQNTLQKVNRQCPKPGVGDWCDTKVGGLPQKKPCFSDRAR